MLLTAGRTYLGRMQPKDLSDSAHLIAIPGTLLAQWESELKLWFLPKKVDIVVYSGKMQQDDLWGPDGMVTLSKHKRSSLIILTSHSVIASYFSSCQLHSFFLQMIQRDFHASYPSKAPGSRKGKLPWDFPPKMPQSPNKTLFNHTYYSVTIDEAHLFRNVGPKHFAALALFEHAQLRLVLTATPLHTSTKVSFFPVDT